MVPNIEVELEVLFSNTDIEDNPGHFFDLQARERGVNVNNLMHDETLIAVLIDIGFSNESTRVLAPEMIRRQRFERP